MTVTEIKAVTKQKFQVELDGQETFVLYRGELSRYGIEEGYQTENKRSKYHANSSHENPTSAKNRTTNHACGPSTPCFIPCSSSLPW